MHGTARGAACLEFGRFRLLTRQRELRLGDGSVPLGSRAFDVLLILVEARGELVTKEELLARVEALARRPRALASPTLMVGDLVLDQATREVRRNGELIDLTPKEYTVLEYLMRHAGRVMSRTLITEYAWGYHFDPGTNIVDVVINHLRKKVDAKHTQRLISTVRGVGYMIKDESADAKKREPESKGARR